MEPLPKMAMRLPGNCLTLRTSDAISPLRNWVLFQELREPCVGSEMTNDVPHARSQTCEPCRSSPAGHRV